MRAWVVIVAGLAGTAHADAPAPRSVVARLTACAPVDRGADRIVTRAELPKLGKGCRVGTGDVAVLVHEGWDGPVQIRFEAWFRRGSVLAPRVVHFRPCPYSPQDGARIAARVYAVKTSGIKRLEILPEQLSAKCVNRDAMRSPLPD